MRIGEIASSTEYWMDEEFQNCQYLESKFAFPNWKNSRNLLIFQFRQFQKFAILKISKICNLINSEFFFKIGSLENFKNCQFGKFERFAIWEIPRKFQFRKFEKILIWKIPKNDDLGNSEKFSILKVPKIVNLGNSKKIPI